jgi:hypothetical protein
MVAFLKRSVTTVLQWTGGVLCRVVDDVEHAAARPYGMINRVNVQVSLDFRELYGCFAAKQILRFMRGMLHRVVQGFQPSVLHVLQTAAYCRPTREERLNSIG